MPRVSLPAILVSVLVLLFAARVDAKPKKGGPEPKTRTPEKPAEKAPEKPAEKPAAEPEPNVDLRGLFTEEPSPRAPAQKPNAATATATATPEAIPEGPEPRMNWVSFRALVDFAYLGDANICSRGAPQNYACTDESGARYTGNPQPNDDVSPGFVPSTWRLVLGYERLLFAGLQAGAFAGYAFRFASEGWKSFFPLHLEGRVTYTFGSTPFADSGPLFHPFVFVAGGVARVDSHVTIRVNEVPCETTIAPVCSRSLDAARVVGDGFASLGGGLRMRIEGRHAVRGGMRATVAFGDSGFVLSPEIAYELGF